MFAGLWPRCSPLALLWARRRSRAERGGAGPAPGPRRRQFIELLSTFAALWMFGIAAVDTVAAGDPPPFYSAGGQFVHLRPLRPVGPMPLVTVDGRRIDLSGLAGTVTLVNVWASWCAPCVAELPSLDRSQVQLGGEGLKVVAISIDGVGAGVARALIDRLRLRPAMVAFDPANRAAHAGAVPAAAGPFPIYALPITYLIDRRGDVVGYFPGAAQWDSSQAIRFLRYFLKPN